MYRIILFCLIFLACRKSFLDVDPLSSQNVEIDNTDKISELLTGAYPQASFAPFLEPRTDNVDDRKKGVVTSMNEAMFFWEDYDQDDIDAPLFFWNDCYRGIAHANKALELLAKYPKNQMVKALYGEAFLLRAYYAFMLANIWCQPYDKRYASSTLGIPYPLSPEKNAFPKYHRGTLDEVYTQIETDLRFGIGLIDDKYYKKPNFHFNKKAAYAFASRFYLHKGVWDSVIMYANFVLGVNPQANLDHGIIAGKDPNTGANLLISSIESRYARELPSIRYGITKRLASSLHNLGIPQCDQFKNLNGFFNRSIKVLASPLPIQDGYYLNKYDESIFSEDISYDRPRGIFVTNILLSTDEVLLNRMEAYTMQGKYSDAIADMENYLLGKKLISTQLRGNCSGDEFTASNPDLYSLLNPFYGLNIQQLGLIQSILNLRRLEFLHEGMRWFDIRRFHLNINRNIQNKRYNSLQKDDPRKTLQIPTEAIRQGLEPNP